MLAETKAKRELFTLSPSHPWYHHLIRSKVVCKLRQNTLQVSLGSNHLQRYIPGVGQLQPV